MDASGVITAKNAGTAKITVKSVEGFEAVYTITTKNKTAANENVAEGGVTSLSETPAPPQIPTCDFNGAGHAQLGICPACGVNSYPLGSLENPAGGAQGESPSDGQQPDGIGGGWKNIF